MVRGFTSGLVRLTSLLSGQAVLKISNSADRELEPYAMDFLLMNIATSLLETGREIFDIAS